MSQTCQHCGATTDDDVRVMCPSCGKRMRPRDAAPGDVPPSEQAPPPPPPPAPGPTPPPPYGAPPPHYGTPPPPYGTPPPAYGTPPPAYGPPLPPYGAAPSAVADVRPAMFFDRAVTERAARLTVAFRLILVLPHFLFLLLYGIGAFFVTIGAWFAALFTAQVPAGMYDFLARYLAYHARVISYASLLTDKWPTVSNDDPYPVVLRLPGPGRLNRAAVLFRIILVIPASIAAGVATGGAQIVAVVNWFIVLIGGRMPAPLFDAYASTTRFYVREQAYLSLLTSTYPAGLFGDPNDGMDAVPPAVAAPADAGAPAEEVAPAPVERRRTPVVGNGARWLIVVFIVIGAIGALASTVVRARGISERVKAANASHDLSEAYHDLNFGSFSACSTPATAFTCYVGIAKQDAQVVATFQQHVAKISFPDKVHAEVATLNGAVQEFRNDFTALAGAKSRDELRTILETLNLEGDGEAFDSAVNALEHKLHGLT